MEAGPVSMSLPVLPLEEVLARLAAEWPEDRLRPALWAVFRMAANGGLGDEDCTVSAKDVASLFDQLIDLSASLRQVSGATILTPAGGKENADG